jgi:hypothetical protein
VKALSIEEVLAEEADAIHGTNWRTKAGLTGDLPDQDAHHARAWMNADEHDGDGTHKKSGFDTEAVSNAAAGADKVDPRKKLYRALNKLNRAALCCSGGGIRSATFCLGVIQALAAYDVTSPAPPPNTPTPATGPATAHNSPASSSEPAEAKPSEPPATRTSERFNSAVKKPPRN